MKTYKFSIFNKNIKALNILLLVCLSIYSCKTDDKKKPEEPIDRYALVTRHNINWNDVNGQIPLGNGEFCFNADGTGLQTFGGSSMSHWAWHSFPLPEGISAEDIPATGTFQQGRNTGLDEFPEDKSELRQWMFDNPHSYNLGRIRLIRTDGNELEEKDIQNIDRTYDLWSGVLTSSFTIDGEQVNVTTSVHPDKDLVSVDVESELLKKGVLQISIDFPYPSINRRLAWVGDFNEHQGNNTILLNDPNESNQADFKREMDDVSYYATINWSSDANIQFDSNKAPNTCQLIADNTNSIKFSCAFSKSALSYNLPDVNETIASSEVYWPSFWKSGGAIDLSESKDPRWQELERRIVLSQYLMAAQSKGSNPPAEVGLMGIDSWRGQFHMEMIWWHLSHYALWDRWDLPQEALNVYERFIPSARALAEQLDYKGLKWQKSVGPEGRTAPWVGNQILIWKQPHPIFFAELDYRLNPNKETLERWAEIIDGTAEHMADYAVRDEETGVYHLEPVMPPSEQGVTKDDIFDLAYWKWGLEHAQIWRERMGLERNPDWEDVLANLEELPVKDGLYLHSKEWEDTYTERNWEHPNTVGVWGMLPPNDTMDYETAHRSLLKVWETWEWKRCWGWDFPWTAMAAARLGEPKMAVDALLIDAGTKNYYDERGVCTGGPCPYLPGNGGLLYAVAMMAAGWDGAPDKHAPGFPDDGSWTVKWEGLHPAP
ncbi:hypothetical protein NO995_09295 [Aestuariibaculum sp. M13]|uniref:hypothetical protein n=1 Tax=Aestuariibaculum sp. M13 TaxID=2967132 RepID=UPI002159F19F|nr:hypothetical protein [Aestuariibaculum sp. M13]MCR8667875.1 hypothetical protein [Aestuariibaculum sp. M13]